jgi:aconitase A
MQEEKCYWDTTKPCINNHSSWKRKKGKLEEGKNQQAKLFEQSTTTRHISTAAGITSTALGLIILSMLTGSLSRNLNSSFL